MAGIHFDRLSIGTHWDNLQETAAKPSPSGHTMIDGPTTATDLDKTEANKALMQSYMDDLLAGSRDKFPGYFEGNNYIQHNPWVADNLTGLLAGLQALAKEGKAVKYDRIHMVLGEGNFILVVPREVLETAQRRTTTCTAFRTEKSRSTGTRSKRFLPALTGKIPKANSESAVPIGFVYYPSSRTGGDTQFG
jgi:predicted SnoaL-like aldol condensation-catalyzing enzyme